jgi:hypothetical protein
MKLNVMHAYSADTIIHGFYLGLMMNRVYFVVSVRYHFVLMMTRLLLVSVWPATSRQGPERRPSAGCAARSLTLNGTVSCT